MVAQHSVMVQSGRGIQYKFKINRKYTIIRGDSATGKTTLVNLISDATIRKTASLSCDVPCVVLPELNWQLNLNALSDSIIFIDEDHPALSCGQELAALMAQSSNCYIIISRDKLPWIPYSYREIYQIHTSGKYHFLEPVYEEMTEFKENQIYVTEDEAAGFQYYQNWYGQQVHTSFGNSNLAKYAQKGTTLIGDGAAIGPYMYDLTLGEANLYLPESFEWLLLHSPIFQNNSEVKNLLNNPVEFIGTEYQSWEEYFTIFLIQITHGQDYQYSKKNLNPCYTDPCCCKGKHCDAFTGNSKQIILSK